MNKILDPMNFLGDKKWYCNNSTENRNNTVTIWQYLVLMSLNYVCRDLFKF